MKKYIRTQAGIYEIKNGKFLETFDVEKYSRDFSVRLADNIEDLCDVIVETKGATGDYKHYIYEGERYEKLKPKIIDDIRTQDFNVYGAIWTDEGLIYVVKMNDKGELELL